MSVSYDPRDPAYWCRFVATAREMHAEHLKAARDARLNCDAQDTARSLRMAAIDRNMIVIAATC